MERTNRTIALAILASIGTDLRRSSTLYPNTGKLSSRQEQVAMEYGESYRATKLVWAYIKQGDDVASSLVQLRRFMLETDHRLMLDHLISLVKGNKAMLLNGRLQDRIRHGIDVMGDTNEIS